MINLNSIFTSEEDIRTKIVYAWLENHGFTANDISVEKSFDIKHGRNTFRIRSAELLEEVTNGAKFKPRADLLVRSCDGRNLLVIEVKALDENLTDDDKTQALSYARLLVEGGIAPFTILTNGKETKIFDSITGELINGEAIPSDYPYAQNNFCVTCSDIALKREALQALISISPENLLAFCENQVRYRMRFLRDEDIFSGKKYIPSLYIERGEAQVKLQKQFDNKQKLILLTGLPQQGKTCFMCHSAEMLLSKHKPCLFYPAIGLQQGLLDALCEDFEWTLGDTSSAYHITQRLNNILSRKQQNLVIFIDGWNEVDRNSALAISEACRRLNSDSITIVLSATNTALPRLLHDSAGNPSYVQDELSLRDRDILDLTIDPRVSKEENVIPLTEYNKDEAEKAFDTYKSAYNVTASRSMSFPTNPFLLRIAMENYANKDLPESLDEPELIRKSLSSKAMRAGFEPDKVVCVLARISNVLFSQGVPLRLDKLEQKLGLSSLESLPDSYFDSAILAKVHDLNNLAAIDFYYGRERDFAVAYLARNWHEIFLQKEKQVKEELASLNKIREVLDALSWFLSLPENINQLKNAVNVLSSVSDFDIKQVVLSSLRQNPYNKLLFKDSGWLDSIIDWVVKEPNYSVREFAPLLIKIHPDSANWWVNFSEKAKSWLTILLGHELDKDYGLDEDYELDEDYVLGNFTLQLLYDLHWELIHDDYYYGDASIITDFLTELLKNTSYTVRANAAYALSKIHPRLLLAYISKRINERAFTLKDKEFFQSDIEMAISELQEELYGSMCPGSLESLKDSPEEFNQMKKICSPIIVSYHPADCSRMLMNILIDLTPKETTLVIEDKRNQLPLPFGEIDQNQNQISLHLIDTNEDSEED